MKPVRLTDKRTLSEKMLDLALRYANGFDEENIESIEKLIAAGADVNARNAQGETMLTIAAQQTETHRIITHNLPLVQSALAHGANPNLVDKKGMPPIFWSVEYNIDENGLNDTCKALIASGANLLIVQPSKDWEESYKQAFDHHIKSARERYDWFMACDRDETLSLTAKDICLFANIDHHLDAFTLDRWHGHPQELIKLLTSLPPWLSQDILFHASWLSGVISPQAPSNHIRCDQADLAPAGMSHGTARS